jgi:hypothetical protein
MELATRRAQDQLILTTGFSVDQADVSGNQIGYMYNTMPGNQPSTYGNTVFIWQTPSEQIPPSKPLKKSAVAGDTPDGSDVFEGLEVTNNSYLLAYATGPELKNAVALVFVPSIESKGPITEFQPSLSVRPGTTSVTFQYAMPGGTRPKTDGDWAGLWEGQPESALYGTKPTWFVPITEDAPVSGGAFRGVSLRRGYQYTVGYFKGGYDATNPKQTTLACSDTFQN